ncbi:MAG: hypothetical protein ACRCX2_08825 [Paraclostridium sp.]
MNIIKKLKSTKGSAMVLTIFAMILISILLVVITNQITNVTKSTKIMNDDMKLKYACESGIEKSTADILEEIKLNSRLEDIEIPMYKVTIKDDDRILIENKNINKPIQLGANIIESESYFEDSIKNRYRYVGNAKVEITEENGNIGYEIKSVTYTKIKN